MQSIPRFSGLLFGALLLSACAAPAATEMADTMLPTPTAAMADAASVVEQPAAVAAESAPPMAATEEMTASAVMAAGTEMVAAADSEPAAAAARPAWQQIALTDARTGAAFTLADFAGKTVFVEPFATWCSNCRQQLGNVQAAKAALGEEVVFVALSVEPNIGADALTRYADDAGFDWVFAAMPQEMLQALAAQYGQTIANPPATPHFLIRPDGSTTDLVTGIESPEAILAQIEAARS